MDGKIWGWEEEGIWKKNMLFVGKLGIDNEKVLGSIVNVNVFFFCLKIDGVRWIGYFYFNVF